MLQSFLVLPELNYAIWPRLTQCMHNNNSAMKIENHGAHWVLCSYGLAAGTNIHTWWL